MLASKFDDNLFSLSKRYVAEPKKDGVRAVCLITHDTARFVTRNGRPLVALDGLAQEVLKVVSASYKNSMLPAAYGDGFVPMVVLDGEVLAGDLVTTISDVRQTRRSSIDAIFEVFDIVPYASFTTDGSVEISFAERRQVLERVFAHAARHERIPLIAQQIVTSLAECYAWQAEWERQGYEGAMIKDLDAPYRKDRSQAWLKLKRHETEDLLVTGSFAGTGRHAEAIGGVVCDFHGVSVRVGSGFSICERRELWRDRDGLVGRMIEVDFQEVTSSGSLRHPRFIRFRDDKN